MRAATEATASVRFFFFCPIKLEENALFLHLYCNGICSVYEMTRAMHPTHC